MRALMAIPELAPTAPLPSARGALLRAFGVVFGLAIIVGNTIGAGILSTPGDIAGRLPSLALFFGVWIAGGLYALLGALNLAELGTMLPRSGGQYVFARHTFGPYAGFVLGWSDWLSTCASIAAVTLFLAGAVGTLVPALASHQVIVASATVLVFTAILSRGARESGRVQTATSLLKALALIVLVGACFLLPHDVEAPRAAVVTPAGGALFAAIVVAVQGIIYTYDGWNGVLYFSEEVHDPARDIPRSMFGGVISVGAIYLLINAALVFVLGLPRMAGEPLVTSAAARALFGGRAYEIVAVLQIALLVSSVNALLLMASRIPLAMSRDGLFPASAASVDAHGTPRLALAASAAGALLFVASGAFNAVLALAAFFFVANYIVSFAAIFVLRRREPTRARPFRAFGYPWTTALALLVSIAFLASAVISDRVHSLWALGVLALSAPSYLVVRRRTQMTAN